MTGLFALISFYIQVFPNDGMIPVQSLRLITTQRQIRRKMQAAPYVVNDWRGYVGQRREVLQALKAFQQNQKS